MKKITSIIFFSMLLSLVCLNSISADTCKLNVSLVSQDPYPATPGDYATLVFQMTGITSVCYGANFELIPTYPFSLDDSSAALKTFSGYTNLQDVNSWIISYKVRVDKDAVNGENPINFKYSAGTSTTSIQSSLDVDIEDARTSFDAVVQDVSGSDVSIAIANTGKYTANSVIIKIPTQDYFETGTTSGQMVGNLNSGDYTMVSFTLTQKNSAMTGMPGSFNRSAMNKTASSSKNLLFDVYYTDAIGERRMTELSLPLSLNGAGSNISSFASMNGFPGRSRFTWSVWYTFAIIIVVLVLLFIISRKVKPVREFFEKLRNKARNHRDGKHYSSKNSENVPDWVKKAINKEKSK